MGSTIDTRTDKAPTGAEEPSFFAPLEARIAYLSPADFQLIQEAYHFAGEAHAGQTRKSGEPYITHPVAVAAQVAQWKLGPKALIAALLHDVMEDCGVSKADIAQRFGPEVAELVDGLTKLDRMQFTTREDNQAESFRKMLLVMARDVRVILVKLADRLHNMRTMRYMPREKWSRIANETLEIYAPIANRLGLDTAYRELQDLCFRHLQPWRYQVLSKAVAHASKRRTNLIEKVKQQTSDTLQSSGMQTEISGRIKPLYSIYQKMSRKRLSFAHVSDLYGFRIIVPSVLDCYKTLGLVHQLYKPVPGRFKDYIAIPKANGYQSLHTTVIGPANINIELQIRTETQDLIAESGVAAHWLYKSGERGHALSDQLGNAWLQSLLEIQSENDDSQEFWNDVKGNLFPDAVYVFSPRGKIVSLPRGATTVDFAYAIHSDIGDRTVAAKINDEQVALRTELSNGDVVEIVTTENATPNPAWLGFVKTGRARSKIRNHLRSLAEDQAMLLGRDMLVQALHAEGIRELPDDDRDNQSLWQELMLGTGNPSRNELLVDIGLGKRSASVIAEQLADLLTAQGLVPDALLLSQARFTAHENISQGAVVLDGSANASIKYANCCHPIPGDGLLGYLARGEGLVVHTDRCRVAQRLQKNEPDRFLTLAWADQPVRPFNVGIVVTVNNTKGALAQVTRTLSDADINIIHISMTDDGTQQALDFRFIIAVRDRLHLSKVLRALRRTPVVLRATRNLS